MPFTCLLRILAKVGVLPVPGGISVLFCVHNLDKKDFYDQIQRIKCFRKELCNGKKPYVCGVDPNATPGCPMTTPTPEPICSGKGFLILC